MIWCLEFEVLQKAYAKSKSILSTEEGAGCNEKFLCKDVKKQMIMQVWSRAWLIASTSL